MTKEVRPRRMIAALVRRADYLSKLGKEDAASSYQKAEQAALLWAIPQLQKLHPEDNPPQGRKTP